MSDKELLYQLISREVDNIIRFANPSLRFLCAPISKYIENFIEPYVNAFFLDGSSLNTEVAGAYAKKEINEKIDDFIKEFQNKRDNEM